MIDKIINLRIFEKEDGKFDESLLDINGALSLSLNLPSTVTVLKGRRPSFSEAMEATRCQDPL